MIRVIRVQEVMDLEGEGTVRAVMVLQNQSGLTLEVPISTEQMAGIVRLNRADGAAPEPAPVTSADVPTPSPQFTPEAPVEPQPAADFSPPGPPPDSFQIEPDLPGEITGVEQF